MRPGREEGGAAHPSHPLRCLRTPTTQSSGAPGAQSQTRGARAAGPNGGGEGMAGGGGRGAAAAGARWGVCGGRGVQQGMGGPDNRRRLHPPPPTYPSPLLGPGSCLSAAALRSPRGWLLTSFVGPMGVRYCSMPPRRISHLRAPTNQRPVVGTQPHAISFPAVGPALSTRCRAATRQLPGSCLTHLSSRAPLISMAPQKLTSPSLQAGGGIGGASLKWGSAP